MKRTRELTDIRLIEITDEQFLNWIRAVFGFEPLYRLRGPKKEPATPRRQKKAA